MEQPPLRFDCRLYVSARGSFAPLLPRETGPRRLAVFTPISYEKLTEPSFRRLLAAFESLGSQVTGS
ncbi:MAG TPA: hypothetical protein VLF67_00575 [Candidatus Saccharimonas sp.]|nr:hypothetical protein [Candidatus Saccharimonas sp.]